MVKCSAILSERTSRWGRKENNQWVIPPESALEVVLRLKNAGQLENEVTLVLMHERLRWIEKHGDVSRQLAECKENNERIQERSDNLQEELNRALVSISDAERRRGDSLERMGSQVIEKLPDTRSQQSPPAQFVVTGVTPSGQDAGQRVIPDAVRFMDRSDTGPSVHFAVRRIRIGVVVKRQRCRQ